jgi:tRNA threonylcarbamoyladenosine biosynthesis protein TsaE
METSLPGNLAGEWTVMPILDERMLDIISHSEAQTRRLGARLGGLLSPGDVIALAGGLGTGKTRFSQGVGQGLGVTEPIVSPTFTLVREYRGPEIRLPLFHVDLYRIENEGETLTFGLEEYLYGDGICLVEWADRLGDNQMPDEYLWIDFHYLDQSKRGLLIQPRGPHYEELLRDFRQEAYGV